MTLFLEHGEVELGQQHGTDQGVVLAARASVVGAHAIETDPKHVAGLIDHMMRNRHGSVFEHNVFTFRIHAPIFVAREFMRHRTFSFNEESGRYKQLDPVFWVPGKYRHLRQHGKASAYELVDGLNPRQDQTNVAHLLRENAEASYRAYQNMLDAGIAREVARTILPVNIFTSFYATCNARALMNFLSLRIDDERNSVPTHPLQEIQEIARVMEWHFRQAMPLTHEAFIKNGRVAP